MEPVLVQKISLPIHTSGILNPSKEVRLSFKVGGVVEHVAVQEGEVVDKGQLLARLKPDEIEAQTRQAQEGFEKTRREFQRVKNLYQDSVVTLEQYQNISTALSIAEANLRIAEFNLGLSVIKAPVRGKILKKFVEQDELVAPGTPVFFFGALAQQWVVRTGLVDRDVIRVRLGDSASVSFDAFPNKFFPAKVTEIAGAADPLSGTFPIELSLLTAEQMMIAGLVAKAQVFPIQKEQVYLLPIEALVGAHGDRGFAFIVSASSDSAQRIPLRIGTVYQDFVTVLEGLENIHQVITDGSAFLSEGDLVQIVADGSNPVMQ